MPKMKTHKGTAKRFRLTKNGKLMRMSSQNSDFRHAVPSTVKANIKQVKKTGGKAVQ